MCAACSPLPFLAILSGWTVTEVGRQPYVVYGFLRTADAASPVAPSAVAGSLTLLICLYLTLLLAFSVYAVRTVLEGPDLEVPVDAPASVRPGLELRASAKLAACIMTANWLPVVLGLVVALAVAMYVVADGFDLGVGILFPFAPSDTARDVMMNSVAPFWDGNETWLVLGGTLLIAAFPLAYATLLPALYVPLMLMLVGLILRGVAFEFRFRARGRRHVWDWAFSGGSALAAFCQGLVLGGFIQGIQVANRAFLGGSFDFAEPVRVRLRPRARRRIQPAWRVMARHEDERRDRGMRPPGRPVRRDPGTRVHRDREHLDAARPSADRAPLVRLAERCHPLPRPDRDGACRLWHLACACRVG